MGGESKKLKIIYSFMEKRRKNGQNSRLDEIPGKNRNHRVGGFARRIASVLPDAPKTGFLRFRLRVPEEA